MVITRSTTISVAKYSSGYAASGERAWRRDQPSKEKAKRYISTINWRRFADYTLLSPLRTRTHT